MDEGRRKRTEGRVLRSKGILEERIKNEREEKRRRDMGEGRRRTLEGMLGEERKKEGRSVWKT